MVSKNVTTQAGIEPAMAWQFMMLVMFWIIQSRLHTHTQSHKFSQ